MNLSKHLSTLASGLALVNALGWAPDLHAAPISVSFYSAFADASGANGRAFESSSQLGAGPSLLVPDTGTDLSTLRIEAPATATGFQLDLDLAHAHGSARGSMGYTLVNFRFTVGPQDVAYALAGRYDAFGPAGTSSFTVSLGEIGGPELFLDQSQSRASANESYLLGAAGDGDFNNVTAGSLTGTLRAGRSYSFMLEAHTAAASFNGAAAQAQGCVSLAIGSAVLDTACGIAAEAAAQQVPEPGSLPLGAVALAGLAAVRRRGR